MGKVLGTRAERWTLAATILVGVVGAVILPATTEAHASSSPLRSGFMAAAPTAPVMGGTAGSGNAVVGTAVKYVRNADGTVRRVR